MPESQNPNAVDFPPFEIEDLRTNLAKFLRTEFDQGDGVQRKRLGGYRCGVYAFFDYDGEPIYVGQTREKIGARIGRHLTNQRTDAVAMSVLDPLEVFEVEVWPLPQFETDGHLADEVKEHLNALESQIYWRLLGQSQFQAVLNEKDPPASTIQVPEPKSIRQRIVSDRVSDIRSHPDVRVARRALIISRLAQVIAERKVQTGLRRVLLTQAKRLQWLAQCRFESVATLSSAADDEDWEADSMT